MWCNATNQQHNMFVYSKWFFQGVLQPFKNGKQRLIINLQNETISDFREVVSKFLNKPVYINWPHCSEAKVFCIIDAKSCRMVEGVEQPVPGLFDSHVEFLKTRWVCHSYSYSYHFILFHFIMPSTLIPLQVFRAWHQCWRNKNNRFGRTIDMYRI